MLKLIYILLIKFNLCKFANLLYFKKTTVVSSGCSVCFGRGCDDNLYTKWQKQSYTWFVLLINRKKILYSNYY